MLTPIPCAISTLQQPSSIENSKCNPSDTILFYIQNDKRKLAELKSIPVLENKYKSNMQSKSWHHTNPEKGRGRRYLPNMVIISSTVHSSTNNVPSRLHRGHQTSLAATDRDVPFLRSRTRLPPQ